MERENDERLNGDIDTIIIANSDLPIYVTLIRILSLSVQWGHIRFKLLTKMDSF